MWRMAATVFIVKDHVHRRWGGGDVLAKVRGHPIQSAGEIWRAKKLTRCHVSRYVFVQCLKVMI